MNAAFRSRIAARVTVTATGCWQWNGSLTEAGYAVCSIGNRRTRVHRATFAEWKRDVGDEEVIDHLCRNRGCVNPDHLDAVPHVENVRRGLAADLSFRRDPITACPYGHEYTVENSYFCRRGTRSCRTCRRERSARGGATNPSPEGRTA